MKERTLVWKQTFELLRYLRAVVRKLTAGVISELRQTALGCRKGEHRIVMEMERRRDSGAGCDAYLAQK